MTNEEFAPIALAYLRERMASPSPPPSWCRC